MKPYPINLLETSKASTGQEDAWAGVSDAVRLDSSIHDASWYCIPGAVTNQSSRRGVGPPVTEVPPYYGDRTEAGVDGHPPAWI